MLKTKAVSFVALCYFVVAFAGVAAAQQNATGTWDVTLTGKNLEGKQMPPAKEQWVFQQDGNQIKGTVKNTRGELPLAGTLTGDTLKAEVTDGDKKLAIFVTVDGDDLYGTLNHGAVKCSSSELELGRQGVCSSSDPARALFVRGRRSN